MKNRIYPWLLGMAALLVYGGYFLFYFTSLYATTATHSAQGILPAMDWTSSAAFTFFLVTVLAFAVVSGLMIAIVATLFFGHVSIDSEQSQEQPAEKALTRAA